ncbi:SDR family oxidoreductase [Alphaproteobacteria bacterium]|nr:SDR family oxidoreductase [Alphaproteobacteria bacterium]
MDDLFNIIDLFRLDGLCAVITGASSGIGNTCAKALAGAGANVVLIGRNEKKLNELHEEIIKNGKKAEILISDITNLDSFSKKLNSINSIDIFLNNAGINEPMKFLSVDNKSYDKILNVNLRAPFFASQVVAKKMIKGNKGGSIINMSSQAAHRALKDRSVYSISKNGLEGLTKSMAYELAKENIRVNSVAPTFVETQMTKPFLSQPSFSSYVKNKIRLNRIAKVEDVASAVLYLASPASSMITGVSLLVDGGWTIH